MKSDHNALRRDASTWALYLLLGYFSYLLNSLGPLFPFLRAEHQLSYAQVSLHSSAFALGLLVTGAVADQLVQWAGPGRLLWGGAFGMALGAVLLTLAQNYAQSLSAALLMGILGSLTLIQVSALLSRRHGTRGAQALTEANAVASMCAFLAPLAVGGAVWSGLGWQAALIAVVCSLFPLAFIFRHSAFASLPQPSESATSAPLPSTYGQLWRVLFLCVAVEFGVGFWAADFLHSVAGLTQAGAAAALSAFLIAVLVGRLIGSGLAFRVSPVQLVRWSLVLALGCFATYWLSDIPIVRVVGLFGTGLGVANLYPLTLALALRFAPGLEDAASARASLASGFAILLAPFTLGTVADLTSLWQAQGLIVLLLLGALFLLRATGEVPPYPADSSGRVKG